ncbi:hypothetical protein [Thalassotalea ganghwensis]
MKRWIETDTATITQSETNTKPTRRVHFMLSPYDVPDAVRALFDDEQNKLIIEFRYIPINEKRQIQDNDGVKFEVGLNTKRIYKIFLDESVDTELVFNTRTAESMEHSIVSAEEAIEKFIQYNEKLTKNNSKKYNAAKSALHNYKHQLASTL